MKRFVCILLVLGLLLNGLCFALAEDAEEEVEFSEEELAEMEEEQEEAAGGSETVVQGEVYHEKTLADFDMDSPALYTGKMRSDFGGSIWSEKDTSDKNNRLLECKGKTVDILYVGLRWMIVRRENVIGYVKREYIAKSDIETVDPANTPPFNVQKHTYIAKTATTCHVRKSMVPSTKKGDDGNNWVILKPGTEISIWKFYKGWAMVNYMREYVRAITRCPRRKPT